MNNKAFLMNLINKYEKELKAGDIKGLYARFNKEDDHNPDWLTDTLIELGYTSNQIIHGAGEAYNNLFADENRFKEITIPASCTYIGADCFSNCENLNKVTFAGNNIKVIKQGAFEYCENLKEITLPEGLEEIGVGAFKGCDNLEKVVLPKSLKTLENYVFVGCDNLKEIVVNKTKDQIRHNELNYGSEAFGDTEQLMKIKFIYLDD